MPNISVPFYLRKIKLLRPILTDFYQTYICISRIITTSGKSKYATADDLKGFLIFHFITQRFYQKCPKLSPELNSAQHQPRAFNEGRFKHGYFSYFQKLSYNC